MFLSLLVQVYIHAFFKQVLTQNVLNVARLHCQKSKCKPQQQPSVGDKATHVIGTPIVVASVNVLKYPFVYGLKPFQDNVNTLYVAIKASARNEGQRSTMYMSTLWGFQYSLTCASIVIQLKHFNGLWLQINSQAFHSCGKTSLCKHVGDSLKEWDCVARLYRC